MDAGENKRMFEAMLKNLIESLHEAALVQMGKLANPETGMIESNLALARNTIDLLRMLREKTANNLTESESRLLEQSIVNLQLKYVEAANPQTGADQAPESTPESTPDKPGGLEPGDAGGPGAQPDDGLPPGSRPGENN